jgi:hypothetical protein
MMKFLERKNNMSKEMEIGQICFGNKTGDYGTEEWQDAMIEYLLNEIERVYWNKEQKEWERGFDPELKGLVFRPYWWGDEDAEGASLPNLKFDFSKQAIYWYKYPGRGQSCEIGYWSPMEWIMWFNKALKVIRKNEPKFY